VADEIAIGVNKYCGAWCVLFGVIMGPHGPVPCCNKEPGHDGDHEAHISIMLEPKIEATVMWRMT
jgi:hypothetical protein